MTRRIKSGEFINITFLFTIITSGLAYLSIYLLLATTHIKIYGFASFLLGMLIYLILRSWYHTDGDVKNLLARTYRILIWLVPLILLSGSTIVYLSKMTVPPAYSAFYSFDDLKWSGPFVIGIWPFINGVILLSNIARFFQIGLYYAGLPLLITLNLIIVILLYYSYKKLLRLCRESVIKFSLIKATLQVISPMIIFAGLLALNSRGQYL